MEISRRGEIIDVERGRKVYNNSRYEEKKNINLSICHQHPVYPVKMHFNSNRKILQLFSLHLLHYLLRKFGLPQLYSSNSYSLL